MADLVSESGEFSCNYCTGKLKLTILKSSSSGESKKLANKTNCFLPPPGANCTFPGLPPGTPCVGCPPGMVMKTGQTTVKIDGPAALGEGAEFMCPLAQMVSLSKAGQTVGKHDEASTSAEVASLVADFTPFVGSGKSLIELLMGEDPITGEEVGRLGAAAGIVLGIVPGGKALVKGKKAAKLAKKVLKKKKIPSKKVVENSNNFKGKFESADYHHSNSSGAKSRGPINGQKTLDNSVQVKSTSPRRIAVDEEAGEFVVFDQHGKGQGTFHGHAREWKELNTDMQNALVRSGKVKVVNGQGKIIK